MADKPEQERQEQQTGPVPVEKHYRVFKDVERSIQEYLKGDPHEHLLIGLRVAYDEKDSSNEPGVLPYTIESGYLGFLDLLFNCLSTEVPRDEGEDVPEEKWAFPLPAAMMDELYEEARKSLQAAAGVDLNVGVFYVFTGSPTKAGGVRCSCGGQTNRKQRVTGSSTNGITSNSCRVGC